jgi:hypothetical protein
VCGSRDAISGRTAAPGSKRRSHIWLGNGGLIGETASGSSSREHLRHPPGSTYDHHRPWWICFLQTNASRVRNPAHRQVATRKSPGFRRWLGVGDQLPNLMVYLQGIQWDEEHCKADVDLCCSKGRIVPFSASRYALLRVPFGENRRSEMIFRRRECAQKRPSTG